MHPVEIEFIPILKQLQSEYELKAKQKNLDLIFNYKTDRTSIFSDEYALTHSLSNLIDNAIKYTNHGFVKVTITDKNDDLCFLVEDSGIGISEDYIKKLFEPYSQEEVGFAKKYEGIGLGLSLTKKLIEMAQGSINVTSKKNIGSSFQLCFPDINSNKS